MVLKDQVNQKGFHCAHLNCRSLYNKIDVINHLLQDIDQKLHVLGLSETWLSENMPDSFISIEGYDITRLDRTWLQTQSNTVKKGGGVTMYIRDSITWSDEMSHS